MNIKLCVKGCSCCPDFDPDFDQRIITIKDDDGNVVKITMAEYEFSIIEYNKQKESYKSSC